LREYIIRRLLLVIPGVIVLTIFVFGLVRLVPGDAIDVIVQITTGYRSGGLSQEKRDELRASLGLDKPIYIQYFIWMSDVVRGDLGKGLHNKLPVLDTIKQRFAVTIELVVFTMFLMVIWGISIGIFSALHQDTWMDYLLRSVAIAGLSIPYFWTAVLLLLFGSLWFNWSPPFGMNNFIEDPWTNIQQFFAPSIILAIALGSALARMTRATIIEVMRQDYIRTARAKGLVDRTVLSRHALKNAMIPVVGLIGVEFAFALGGTVILERIWTLPGMGQLMLTAIERRNYPMIQGIILILGSLVMVVNLLVDLSYAWLNPRIRYQ